MSIDTPVEEMSREDLEDEVRDLRGHIRALEARMDATNTRLERISIAAFDEPLGEVNEDEFDSLRPRLLEIEETVEKIKKDQRMLVSDVGGGRATPDDRAKLIRQTLLNKARSNEGESGLTRDQVDARLDGGLHRDTLMDAMKRAADGHKAEGNDRDYTPINGSSDLLPVDAITFRVSDGKDKQSVVSMDLEDSTATEVRQNLTTEQSDGGGEKQP